MFPSSPREKRLPYLCFVSFGSSRLFAAFVFVDFFVYILHNTAGLLSLHALEAVRSLAHSSSGGLGARERAKGRSHGARKEEAKKQNKKAKR
jgi:hypothetical protein